MPSFIALRLKLLMAPNFVQIIIWQKFAKKNVEQNFDENRSLIEKFTTLLHLIFGKHGLPVPTQTIIGGGQLELKSD